MRRWTKVRRQWERINSAPATEQTEKRSGHLAKALYDFTQRIQKDNEGTRNAR